MKFITSILVLLFTFNLVAQDATVTADDPVVKKFTETYDLNDPQVLKMITIQERRVRNLNEIAQLRDTNAKLYLQKRQAINKGTQVSVKMMMNPEQRKAFDVVLLELREQKVVKAGELKEGGLPYSDIEIALVDLEDELY